MKGSLIVAFVFGVILCGISSGCVSEYNLATGRREFLLYSTEKEVNIGRSISRQVEKKYKVLSAAAGGERVERIGEKIAAACDRRDIVYYFKALDAEEVNAISLPGGFVYVNKGLLDIATDDELAGVIGHEVAHIVARHSIKKLQASMGYMLARILAVSVAKSPRGAIQGADIAFNQILLGYSRQDELLADKVGLRYSARAGFKPEAMITFLRKLQKINRDRPVRPLFYNRTHPYTSERIRRIKQELGKNVDFRDYIR
ncbi:MAG: M48 family metalloprotease [Candidatus Omnitrophota bacterium]